MVRRRPTLSAALSALAGILILASGCAEQSPTTVQLKAPTALNAAKAYAKGSFSASIGTDGGTLNFPIGEITFPAGALTEETVITATVNGKSLEVDFQPHLVFPAGAQPTLSISFAGLDLDASRLVVYHSSDRGELQEKLVPSVHSTQSAAFVTAPSFSRYALASE